MEKFESIEFFKNKNQQYIVDGLTKTVIKSEMFGYMESLIEENVPFTMFFIDIDYFKTVNDTYGHKVGDDVLAKIAETIRENADENSLVGRFGGDEFIVVAKGLTDYNLKWTYGQKLCHSVSRLALDFGDSHETQTISITQGISTFPNDAGDLNTLMEKADKALYRGKQKGRNCFVIFNKALHENIKLGEDVSSLEISKIIEYIYDEFTQYGPDPYLKLDNITYFLTKLFKFDRVLTLVEGQVHETYVKENDERQFFIIPEEKYNEIGYKNVPFLAINFRIHFVESNPEIFKMLEDQNVNSQLIVRIATNSHDYGYIRVDKKRETIWNPDIKILFQILAGLFAMAYEHEVAKISN